MKLWLDCEYNGAELISLALIDERGFEFYEVLPCENPLPWVADNVIPVLGQPAISRLEFQTALAAFLGTYDSIHVVADWPEDIAFFCQSLITGPGERMDTPPLTMEVVRVDTVSLQPHNALADVRAIREALL